MLTILYVCESGKGGGGFVNSEKWGGGLGTYLDYGIWFVNWKSMKDIARSSYLSELYLLFMWAMRSIGKINLTHFSTYYVCYVFTPRPSLNLWKVTTVTNQISSLIKRWFYRNKSGFGVPITIDRVQKCRVQNSKIERQEETWLSGLRRSGVERREFW